MLIEIFSCVWKQFSITISFCSILVISSKSVDPAKTGRFQIELTYTQLWDHVFSSDLYQFAWPLNTDVLIFFITYKLFCSTNKPISTLIFENVTEQ